jgi:hypothetical protein
MVRLRAAAALAMLPGEEQRVLLLAHKTGDRYALRVLVSELERAGKLASAARGREDVRQIILLGGGVRAAAEAGHDAARNGEAIANLAFRLEEESLQHAAGPGRSS